jgi:hypothetical protein
MTPDAASHLCPQDVIDLPIVLFAEHVVIVAPRRPGQQCRWSRFLDSLRKAIGPASRDAVRTQSRHDDLRQRRCQGGVACRATARAAGAGRDERLTAAVEVIRVAERKDGTWPRHQGYPGKMWFPTEASGPSRWATLWARRVMQWWDRSTAA